MKIELDHWICDHCGGTNVVPHDAKRASDVSMTVSLVAIMAFVAFMAWLFVSHFA